MRSFKWTKAHAAFIPEIDAEHRNLYRIGEELHEALVSGATASLLVEKFRALAAAAEEHFTYEERLMRSSHYASMAWHKHQHDTYRKRIAQFLPQIEAGDTQACILLLDFTSDWFRDHTGLTDRMLGAFLRNWGRLQARAAS